MKCLDKNSYDKGKCTDVSGAPFAVGSGMGADLWRSPPVLPSSESPCGTGLGGADQSTLQYRDCKKSWVSGIGTRASAAGTDSRSRAAGAAEGRQAGWEGCGVGGKFSGKVWERRCVQSCGITMGRAVADHSLFVEASLADLYIPIRESFS